MNTSHTLRTALMAAALLFPVASQAITWYEAQRKSCSPGPDGQYVAQDYHADFELPSITRTSATLALKPGQKRYRGSLKYDHVYGGDGNEKIFGMRSYDELCGGAGDDLLKGGALVDTLDGGPGNDTLFAGPNRARDLINRKDMDILRREVKADLLQLDKKFTTYFTVLLAAILFVNKDAITLLANLLGLLH